MILVVSCLLLSYSDGDATATALGAAMASALDARGARNLDSELLSLRTDLGLIFIAASFHKFDLERWAQPLGTC